MFFKRKKKIDVDALYEEMAKGRDQLDMTLSELNNEINSLISAIHEKDEIIRKKDEIIRRKDDVIIHLEKVIQSGEKVIDSDTRLYNREYYDKYMKNKLNESFYVLTVIISNYEHKFDQFYRNDIAKVINDFCLGMEMTPILWEEDKIRIFLRVEPSKSDRLRENITDLLKKTIRDKELRLDFRNFTHM